MRSGKQNGAFMSWRAIVSRRQQERLNLSSSFPVFLYWFLSLFYHYYFITFSGMSGVASGQWTELPNREHLDRKCKVPFVKLSLSQIGLSVHNGTKQSKSKVIILYATGKINCGAINSVKWGSQENTGQIDTACQWSTEKHPGVMDDNDEMEEATFAQLSGAHLAEAYIHKLIKASGIC